ncbi:MAG: arginase family protein [Candidatus Rokuibacteriota bacterium]
MSQTHVGGEHTVSFGAVKACGEKYPDLAALHVAAHSDMRDEYHATAAANAARGYSVCCNPPPAWSGRPESNRRRPAWDGSAVRPREAL